KISGPTKSFIVIFCAAIVGVYLSLMLWSDYSYQSSGSVNLDYENYLAGLGQNGSPRPNASEAVPNVDTSAWETYTNKNLHLSFKYKPGWKILPAKVIKDYSLIQIDPGAKYYNIKIYVSSKDFYIMGGLPTTAETIGGEPALNVSNALYGVRANKLYYTFDIGLSMSLLPDFNGLVHSATFAN
ncbi:MAG TPA: hypothetical protein VE973_04085, partial [Candidatus Limnocylindria bacterium]|nr:hypothetical protein [Candidatus Limnocylindria bacterium]